MRTKAAYDADAPNFDRHRGLPNGVAPAIRATVLGSIGAKSPPRLLDIGAGTGRIGWPFVAAGDNYVGVDLSLGMLREFVPRPTESDSKAPCLVQADGELLPFRNATFDAVMLMHVLNAVRDWRRLISETTRVLRPNGHLIVGRTVAPANGVDAQMKQHLSEILHTMSVESHRKQSNDDALRWLTREFRENRTVTAAIWTAERTPRRFLQRHRHGGQFSVLPDSIKNAAMLSLGDWASAHFGSLDSGSTETFCFELTICHLSRESRSE